MLSHCVYLTTPYLITKLSQKRLRQTRRPHGGVVDFHHHPSRYLRYEAALSNFFDLPCLHLLILDAI